MKTIWIAITDDDRTPIESAFTRKELMVAVNDYMGLGLDPNVKFIEHVFIMYSEFEDSYDSYMLFECKYPNKEAELCKIHIFCIEIFNT